MNSLETLSKRKVNLTELSLMIRLVTMEFGSLSNESLCDKINEEFDVCCTLDDIKNYNKATLVNEDYELEERKLIWI